MKLSKAPVYPKPVPQIHYAPLAGIRKLSIRTEHGNPWFPVHHGLLRWLRLLAKTALVFASPAEMRQSMASGSPWIASSATPPRKDGPCPCEARRGSAIHGRNNDYSVSSRRALARIAALRNFVNPGPALSIFSAKR